MIRVKNNFIRVKLKVQKMIKSVYANCLHSVIIYCIDDLIFIHKKYTATLRDVGLYERYELNDDS